MIYSIIFDFFSVVYAICHKYYIFNLTAKWNNNYHEFSSTYSRTRDPSSNTLLEKRSIIKIITFFSHYPFFFFFFLPLSQKSRRQELHRHISLHSETFRNLSSFSLKEAFQHYPFALLCRDEARSSSAFSYLKRFGFFCNFSINCVPLFHY